LKISILFPNYKNYKIVKAIFLKNAFLSKLRELQLLPATSLKKYLNKKNRLQITYRSLFFLNFKLFQVKLAAQSRAVLREVAAFACSSRKDK